MKSSGGGGAGAGGELGDEGSNTWKPQSGP